MTEDDKALVDRLRSLAGEWFEMCDDIHEPLGEAANCIEALSAENEKLREALWFYANNKNYRYIVGADCTSVDIDAGDTARAALGETK